MAPQAIISPSVLASDLSKLSAECQRMMDNGCDWLHMLSQTNEQLTDVFPGVSWTLLLTNKNSRADAFADVMDGHFVPNLTMGAPILEWVAKNVPGIFMDVHCMVSKPKQWVGDVAKAGGKQYTFHYEAVSSPEEAKEVIDLIHSHGMRAGLAISPDTASTVITDELANAADMLLVMTVRPGFGGQKFMAECLPKVSELRARFPEKDIQVDGGVGAGNACQCAKAGSNVLVAGSAIFGAKDPKATISEMRGAVNAEFTK